MGQKNTLDNQNPFLFKNILKASAIAILAIAADRFLFSLLRTVIVVVSAFISENIPVIGILFDKIFLKHINGSGAEDGIMWSKPTTFIAGVITFCLVLKVLSDVMDKFPSTQTVFASFTLLILLDFISLIVFKGLRSDPYESYVFLGIGRFVEFAVMLLFTIPMVKKLNNIYLN